MSYKNNQTFKGKRNVDEWKENARRYRDGKTKLLDDIYKSNGLIKTNYGAYNLANQAIISIYGKIESAQIEYRKNNYTFKSELKEKLAACVEKSRSALDGSMGTIYNAVANIQAFLNAINSNYNVAESESSDTVNDVPAGGREPARTYSTTQTTNTKTSTYNKTENKKDIKENKTEETKEIKVEEKEQPIKEITKKIDEIVNLIHPADKEKLDKNFVDNLASKTEKMTNATTVEEKEQLRKEIVDEIKRISRGINDIENNQKAEELVNQIDQMLSDLNVENQKEIKPEIKNEKEAVKDGTKAKEVKVANKEQPIKEITKKIDEIVNLIHPADKEKLDKNFVDNLANKTERMTNAATVEEKEQLRKEIVDEIKRISRGINDIENNQKAKELVNQIDQMLSDLNVENKQEIKQEINNEKEAVIIDGTKAKEPKARKENKTEEIKETKVAGKEQQIKETKVANKEQPIKEITKKIDEIVNLIHPADKEKLDKNFVDNLANKTERMTNATTVEEKEQLRKEIVDEIKRISRGINDVENNQKARELVNQIDQMLSDLNVEK